MSILAEASKIHFLNQSLLHHASITQGKFLVSVTLSCQKFNKDLLHQDRTILLLDFLEYILTRFIREICTKQVRIGEAIPYTLIDK